MRQLDKILFAVVSAFMAVVAASAQEGKTGYQFLNIPVSAHSAALGGSNISITEDDASLMFTNAALINNVSDNTVSLGYNSYMSSSSMFSAAYIKEVGERGAWALGAQMLNYGKMDETDELGNVTGSFTAKDINIQTSFAYMLNEYWSGAITAKAIMSNYGQYSSTAIGADLSLNYFDPQRGWSISAVGRNMGGQVKSLYDDAAMESLPFNLALGISKDFSHAPIRVSVTADDLTHWSEVKGIQHLIIGADILPSKNTWVGVGFNCRRAHEMKVQDKSHWAGFNIGAGLNVNKFKVGVAYGKYHVASSSIIINAAFSL